MFDMAQEDRAVKPAVHHRAANSASTQDKDLSERIQTWISGRIAESARWPDGFMKSIAVEITPEAAGVLLKAYNRDNRPMRAKRVDEFAQIIREGRWRLTSQGISFSRDGHLNNGQHRLAGILKAGVAVQLYLTFGEDRDVFDVLDTGSVRGGSDTLAISGYKNTSCLAAAARFLVLVDGNIVFNPPKIRNDEILRIVAKHPHLEAATVPGHTIGSKFKCSTTALTVAFYLIKTRSRQAHKFDEFVERLRTGSGLEARDPILVLRDGLQTKEIDKHVRSQSLKTLAQYASVIKAWNLFIRGRRGSLRWEHPAPLPRPE